MVESVLDSIYITTRVHTMLITEQRPLRDFVRFAYRCGRQFRSHITLSALVAILVVLGPIPAWAGVIGFVRDAAGTFSVFDVADSGNVQVHALNDAGLAAGNYSTVIG